MKTIKKGRFFITESSNFDNVIEPVKKSRFEVIKKKPTKKRKFIVNEVSESDYL